MNKITVLKFPKYYVVVIEGGGGVAENAKSRQNRILSFSSLLFFLPPGLLLGLGASNTNL